MRPLPVLIIGLTLAKLALIVGVASLIRFSPADPEPTDDTDAIEPVAFTSNGEPLYSWQV